MEKKTTVVPLNICFLRKDKIEKFPARLELATFRVLGGLDNHYTTETTIPLSLENYTTYLTTGTKGKRKT